MALKKKAPRKKGKKGTAGSKSASPFREPATPTRKK